MIDGAIFFAYIPRCASVIGQRSWRRRKFYDEGDERLTVTIRGIVRGAYNAEQN